MSALDNEFIRQQARLKRSFSARIKDAMLSPWDWGSCEKCGRQDAKKGVKPRCNDIAYSNGYTKSSKGA